VGINSGFGLSEYGHRSLNKPPSQNSGRRGKGGRKKINTGGEKVGQKAKGTGKYMGANLAEKKTDYERKSFREKMWKGKDSELK